MIDGGLQHEPTTDLSGGTGTKLYIGRLLNLINKNGLQFDDSCCVCKQPEAKPLPCHLLLFLKNSMVISHTYHLLQMVKRKVFFSFSLLFIHSWSLLNSVFRLWLPLDLPSQKETISANLFQLNHQSRCHLYVNETYSFKIYCTPSDVMVQLDSMSYEEWQITKGIFLSTWTLAALK